MSIVTALGSATGKVLVQVQSAPSTPGSVDPSFDAGQGAGSWSFPIAQVPVDNGLRLALGSQGRVYVSGPFRSFNGTPAAQLVALKEDGSVDETFRWNR